ncbi:MAG: apolipoprotein N-acyltransferase [Nautiliaceae bacterium]
MQLNLVDWLPAQHIKNSFSSFFKRYFNTNSLISAILLSLPIYLYDFKEIFPIEIINEISIFFGFYFLITKRISLLWFGFFIGLFWFWWVGLSFRYYNLSFLIPFISLLIAIGYGGVFWIVENIIFYLSKKLKKLYPLSWEKILLIFFIAFGLEYFKPFTFDWLKFDILFLSFNHFLTKWEFLIFLIGFLFINTRFYYLSFFFITIPILFSNPTFPKSNIPLKIKLISTNIPQDKKWDTNYIPIEIKENIEYIKKAIKQKYDVVVLPESAFPLFLNHYPNLMEKLKFLSKKITIITGALHEKENKFYNSSYIFENEKVTILDKHILVPFGEYIPFPIFQKEINNLFFDGASDYATSSNFNTFKIKNIPFINAICYEATIKELYKLSPKYIIAQSNMAWFMPSIAPVLQKMLIEYYANKYQKIVFHSLNGYKSYVAKPIIKREK